MSKKPNRNLTARVEKAAVRVLQRNGYLTYPLLLVELGILAPGHLEDWRAGRVPFLEKVIQSNLTKLSRIQTAVRRYTRTRGFDRTVRRPRRGRRYSKTGHPFVEEEYAARYQARSRRAAKIKGGQRAETQAQAF